MIAFESIISTDVEPVTEPVLLADAKVWAIVDHDDDDDLIEEIITGARQDIEKETNLALIPKTVVGYITTTKENEYVKLPYGTPSAIVVSSVDDGDGTEELLTLNDGYYLRGSKYVALGGYGTHKISYSVGYTVPIALKQAIKMLVTYRVKYRGDNEKQQGFPEDVAYRISKYAEIYI